MKLQYASDLHIEFPENKNYLKKNPIKPVGDILILAGDIVPLALKDDHSDFFDYLSDNFKLTYWLPGNHEYYHSDIGELDFQINERIRENIFIVNNLTIHSGNVNLIFSTLWTRISSNYMGEIQMSYSDFHAIRYKGELFSIEHYNSIHKKCLDFLEQALAVENKGTSIVVTHHVPVIPDYPKEYKTSILNEAFAVDLSDLIKTHKPDYWIFGHLHRNKGDFKIGKTRLVTNQIGYVMYFEQSGFNNRKYIRV